MSKRGASWTWAGTVVQVLGIAARAPCITALVLGILVTGPANAVGQAASGSENPLGLDEAVERALVMSPVLGAAAAQVDRAEAVGREAEAAWYPSVRLSGSATRHEEPMLVRPLHGFDPTETPPFDETLIQGEATVAYTLFDGGARSARIRRASRERDAAGAELERAQAAVTARVVVAYLEVVGGAEVLEAHAQRLEALESEASRVRSLLAEGVAPEIQLLRAEAALEAARAEAVAARSALETAELELARLTGVAPGRARHEALAPVTLKGAAVPDREAAVARARSSNPEVLAAQRAVAAAEAGVSLARSARLPDVDAFGTYWERGGGDTEFVGEWAAGVKVSFPAFTGGAVSSRIDQARAGTRAASDRLRQVELEVGRQVDVALARVEEMAARESALERAAKRQAAVVASERVSLEVGVGTQSEYLRAQADLLSARASLAQARHARLAAHVELARVLGQLDAAWIRDALEVRG